VVVDNGSADGSAEAARQAGADIVIENGRNLGFARAVNIGLEAAGGAAGPAELVLLLNPDARVSPEALELLCKDLGRDPSVAVAGPLLRDEDGALTAGAGRTATLITRVGQCVPLVGRDRRVRPEYTVPREPSERAGPADVGYLYGAAMLVERRFLSACGGLDERFFLFAEDEDLCRQARRAGRRVVLDGRAEAVHAGGASCSDGPLIEAQRLFSTWRLFDKWDGPRRAATYHRGVLAAFGAHVGESQHAWGWRAHGAVLAPPCFASAPDATPSPWATSGSTPPRTASSRSRAVRRISSRASGANAAAATRAPKAARTPRW
jgi:hypothetical protein